ncbi:hypothetical protein AADZ90_008870 [Aestuariibius sp. 2305UL40-4]|uniref:hypothetical protein n=1 Tax=Aestuariibius violaceus TaxID=3234132 RepID=UPI00345E33A7
MRIDAAAIRAFPKFYYYLTVDIPNLASNQAIVGSIKSFSGKTTKATIKTALKWGSDPEIKLVKNLICASSKAYGCYSWGSNVIQVEEQLVVDFEAGKGVKRRTTRGHDVYLLGATILHELTHWADAHDGVDDLVPGDPTNEEGNAFEKAVYGKVM